MELWGWLGYSPDKRIAFSVISEALNGGSEIVLTLGSICQKIT